MHFSSVSIFMHFSSVSCFSLVCDGLGPLIHTSITFNSNRSSTSAGGNFAQSLENPTNLQPVFLSCRLPLSKLLPGLFVRKSHFCKFSAMQCDSTSYVHCCAMQLTVCGAFFQLILRESLEEDYTFANSLQYNVILQAMQAMCIAVQLTEVHFSNLSLERVCTFANSLQNNVILQAIYIAVQCNSLKCTFANSLQYNVILQAMCIAVQCNTLSQYCIFTTYLEREFVRRLHFCKFSILFSTH